MLTDDELRRMAVWMPTWLKRWLWALSFVPVIAVIAVIWTSGELDQTGVLRYLFAAFMLGIGLWNANQYWRLRQM